MAESDIEIDDYDFLIKFLVLGDTSVGKTCLLQMYVDNVYKNSYGSTIGVDLMHKSVVYKPKYHTGIIEKEAKLNLQLWDTAGQERFRCLTVSFFRDAMGYLLVFDLTDEKTFINVRDWMRLLIENSYSETPDIILVGNKKDLTTERVISYNDASKLAQELNIPYIETSAFTGQNIEEAFTILIDLVMERINKITDQSLLPIMKKNLKSKAKTNNQNNCLC